MQAIWAPADSFSTSQAFINFAGPVRVLHRPNLDYGPLDQPTQDVCGVRTPCNVGDLVDAREYLHNLG